MQRQARPPRDPSSSFKGVYLVLCTVIFRLIWGSPKCSCNLVEDRACDKAGEAVLIIKSARQKWACWPEGTVQRGTHWWLCKAAINAQSSSRTAGQLLAAKTWAPGNAARGGCGVRSTTGRRKTKQRMVESCFSRLTLCHRAASQDNGSPQMKPLLGSDSLTGNTDVSRGSATVTVQHPLSQTLAFTGSRLPCCVKTQEAKAASLPALFLSLFPVTQTQINNSRHKEFERKEASRRYY